MDVVRQALADLPLSGTITVGILAPRHLLPRPTHEADVLRLRAKETWFIKGSPLKIFRWSPDFSPLKESPLAPVWISFPSLPIHLISKIADLASCIGTPLITDRAAEALSCARILVEHDLRIPQLQRIRVILPPSNSFWQRVIFERIQD